MIVTVMVLELRGPDEPAFAALWPLWPPRSAMPQIGINFVHLFLVSLLPIATAWIARTRLAASPVVFYAGLFVAIDIAYNFFEHEALAPAAAHLPARSILHLRPEAVARAT